MAEKSESRDEVDPEEVQYALVRAKGLLEEVNNYRDVAESIDERFKPANEHRQLTLDDMPYGEELIRTRELPANLEGAIARLEKLANGNVPVTQAREELQAVQEVIEEARNILDDCTRLPSTEGEDDDE